jgi:tetratricopeptide (TPR) repeat protein
MIACYQQLKPNALEGWYWQGKLLQRGGKKNEALTCYRDLLAKRPQYSPAYAAAVDLLMTAETPEGKSLCKEILQAWQQALPNDLLMWQAEIRYQATQGNLAHAREIIDKRLAGLEGTSASEGAIQTVGLTNDQQKQPALARALTAGFLAQGLMKAGQYQEATIWLQRALQNAPGHEPTLLLLGEAFLQRMFLETAASVNRKALARQAAACYQQIYKNKKGDPLVGNNLAWLQISELGDSAEAYRIAQEVRLGKFFTKPLPGEQLSADFLDTLGLIYEKMASADQTAERIELFESAQKRYTQDPRVFLHLGHAYSAAKETKKAQQAYEKALSLLESSPSLSAARKQSLQSEIERGQARLRQLAGKTVPQ